MNYDGSEQLGEGVRRFKGYPAYKDSGFPWLGRIPNHWNAHRLKWSVSRVGSGKTPKGGAEIYSSSGVVFLRSQNVHFDGLRLEDVVYIDEDIDREMAATRVQPEDILLNITGASLGRCCLVPSPFQSANVNQHVCILRPRKHVIEPRFLHLCISSKAVQTQIFSNENGTSREGLNFVQVANLVFASTPDCNEQRQIAAFLGRETAKIDALVAKKERLIELLQEKRTALISHAVTKGLDPHVPMKDSGIEWLGQIPAHWDVKRLKYLAVGKGLGIQMGPFGSMLKTLSNEVTGFKLYGQENTINDNFDVGHRWVTREQYQEMAHYRIMPGDILLTRKGSIGKCRLVPPAIIPGIIDSDTIRLRADQSRVDSRFLVQLLHEAWYIQKQINASRRGAILSGLNTTNISELLVLVPPLDEQLKLLDHLGLATSQIDALMTKIREGIELLREYRTALISAAVTGKIDVREEESASETVSIPISQKQPNPYFRRTVFAAEIIDQLCEEPTFGHVKFQKCLYMAQHHLHVEDFEETYYRKVAGPYDNRLIRSIDSQLEKSRWFKAEKRGERYTYRRLEKSGNHREYFDRYFGVEAEKLKSLLDLFRPLDTERCEIIATLYAVWNDFLIQGEPFDDDRILDEVLTNWDKSKTRIPRDRWQKALQWMRDKELVPAGFGKPTKPSGGGTS